MLFNTLLLLLCGTSQTRDPPYSRVRRPSVFLFLLTHYPTGCHLTAVSPAHLSSQAKNWQHACTGACTQGRSPANSPGLVFPTEGALHGRKCCCSPSFLLCQVCRCSHLRHHMHLHGVWSDGKMHNANPSLQTSTRRMVR